MSENGRGRAQRRKAREVGDRKIAKFLIEHDNLRRSACRLARRSEEFFRFTRNYP